ncbi:MAG: Sb-PDE family phosphodiesterase [Flavobacteriaceae bacterium]|nr:Sb-PDE family phosphodiesterase [Flavobacteriaceae bacterium]
MNNKFKSISFLLLSIGVSFSMLAQHHHDRKINFPDVPGYLTLKCDFHQHSIFSDGKVYPSIRVEEAIKDGLDAISITEHLEYQPHKEDIPHPDRNRAYQIALETKKSMKDTTLIIANGSEITREMPPGHSNAIFIKDANLLLKDSVIDVFREAKKQGAFIFWNHPHWKGQAHDGVAKLTDIHKKLIKEKLINGIEIVNEHVYSTEALEIALANDLTFIGASDVHGLIDWEYNVHKGGHRPITLVFAKEKSEEGIKAALFDRSTAIWFNNTLIGKQEFLEPLINASLIVKKAKYLKTSWSQHKKPLTILEVIIQNNSDAEYILENTSDYLLHNNADIVTIAPQHKTIILVKTKQQEESINLSFNVLNAVVAPKKHAHIQMKITIDK